MTETTTPATIGAAAETPVLPVITITPRDHGSYRVAGPVALVDPEGGRWVVPEGKAVFLCRCGQSRTKPFCDGSHGTTGFESAVRAPAVAPEG